MQGDTLSALMPGLPEMILRTHHLPEVAKQSAVESGERVLGILEHKPCPLHITQKVWAAHLEP